MKFGVMMHKHTQNIGDDIQTYAAARLLPRVDYFLDRERLDEFTTDDGEPAAVVMSAWYMWHKWNWPPSRYIMPLYVGMHYSDHELAKQDGSPVKTEFLSGLGGDYLNAYGPVGCRDTFTEKTFKEMGIDAYFSGCITLTLPKMPIVKHDREYVCTVDISKAAVEHTRKLLEGTDIELKEIRHYKDYRNSDASWEERVKNVTDLLTVYQNAKCVVTRRLHCALPCLAMGVPVLILNNEKEGADIRFEPYYDWTYNCTREQYISGEYGYDITDPPENPDDYMPYRESLIKAVNDFVQKYKDVHGSAEQLAKTSYTDGELMQWRHDVMKDCMNRWLYVTRDHINGISKLEKKLAATEKKLGDEKKKTKELADTKKQLDTAKKEIAELKAKLSSAARSLEETKTSLDTTVKESAKLKKVISCRSVRYSVKLRNAFVGRNKKIKIENYI